MAFPADEHRRGYRRLYRLTTARRLAKRWPGSDTDGLIPKGVLVTDTDENRVYMGDGTPEAGPLIANGGTIGGLRVGPEIRGLTTQVQFNDGGQFAGDANFTWDKTNRILAADNVNATETFALSGIISPSGLTTTTNNYAPTGIGTCGVLRVSTNGANRNLTGIESQTGSIIDGRVLILENIDSTFDINLVNDSSLSDADNRFYFSETATPNVTLALKANSAVALRYDNTSQKWRVQGTRPTRHFHSGASDGGKIVRTIPWNVVTPATSSDPFLLYTEVAITIQSTTAYIAGTTNVVYNILFASSRTGSTTSVFTSNITLTSTAGQINNSGFNDNTIPAASYVWVDVVSVSGSPTRFDGQIEFTQDFA